VSSVNMAKEYIFLLLNPHLRPSAFRTRLCPLVFAGSSNGPLHVTDMTCGFSDIVTPDPAAAEWLPWMAKVCLIVLSTFDIQAVRYHLKTCHEIDTALELGSLNGRPLVKSFFTPHQMTPLREWRDAHLERAKRFLHLTTVRMQLTRRYHAHFPWILIWVKRPQGTTGFPAKHTARCHVAQE